MTQPLDKTALRVSLRALRRRLAEEVPDVAERAARRLPLSRFSRFRIVSAYRPQGSELDPMPLLQAILDIKPGFAQAALPVAVDRDAPLRFRLWRPEDPLAPDAVGVPSPAPEAQEVAPNLVIAPLLGFDRRGGRLGQGGGHYDRTLAELRAKGAVFVLGLAYAGQLVDEIPMEPHDQPLDAVLTEVGYIALRRD